MANEGAAEKSGGSDASVDGGRAEVIVVGAGPGGSAAALALARAGRRVVLLEAERFPRDKVCGDVLLPELEEHLGALGLSLDALAHDARSILGCRYTSPAGRQVTGQFRDARARTHRWRILPRLVFDHRLARAAVEGGVELREEHRLVDLQWDDERRLNRLETRVGKGEDRRTVVLEAPLVIGADGAGSPTARARGLRPSREDRPEDTAVALRSYLPWPADEPYLRVVTNERIAPGCCWVVPNARGEANVGIVVVAADRRRQAINLHHELESVLGREVELGRARRFSGWKLPGGSVSRRAVADGLLLVGDAAGFIDPFTGHGIQNALLSGRLAARAADRALANARLDAAGPALAGYETAWRRALRHEFRLGKILRWVHSTPWVMEPVIARARHSRRWADRFMGLVGHAIPRHQVLSPGFLLDFLRPTGRWPAAGE